MLHSQYGAKYWSPAKIKLLACFYLSIHAHEKKKMLKIVSNSPFFLYFPSAVEKVLVEETVETQRIEMREETPTKGKNTWSPFFCYCCSAPPSFYCTDGKRFFSIFFCSSAELFVSFAAQSQTHVKVVCTVRITTLCFQKFWKTQRKGLKKSTEQL